MSELIPHDLTQPDTAANDPRLGRWLSRQDNSAGSDVVIVGFPSDEGVRRNGGRAGAADGPRALREVLYRLTPDAELPDAFESLLTRTADIGDVRVTGEVEDDQRRLADVIAPLIEEEKTVVILGGGHETSFGHFLGYANAGLRVDILNIDAHADVRQLREGQAHSGSPFRQALEHPSKMCARYRVAGLQPHSSARSHLQFVREHGGETIFRRDLTTELLNSLVDDLHAPAMVTMDIDAVDAAQAPGVSAPNAGGLNARIWLEAAYLAGKSASVQSLDVVELNPKFEVDHRTARLAALTVWEFLRGVASR